MPARIIVPARVRTFDAHGEVRAGPDRLAGEEPLEIRLDGQQFTVTMRTPGDDFELVTGLLLSEAVITEVSHVVKMDYRSGVDRDGHRTYNVVDVRLAPGAPGPDRGAQRQVFTSSSCGVCGTPSLDAVVKPSAHPVAPPRPLVPAARLVALPDELRGHQRVFDATGGVHAAALFPVGSAEPLVVREDVGRHNAVDKVVGWAVQRGLLPLHEVVLQVSARASFELVNKAAMAGIPVLSAVSAPSALAVTRGRESGVTVVGFNRRGRCNVYTHPERITA
ncbi:formate dehydrogenase accessory sulfurtransferase FdhD [Kocuria sp.]|uniref:formate dehydrogenase accessory sulfurtransferase FdhD n=1 Tax=Kocuria sp. TaxID=1871328 RepID=UPI0026DC1192|nr:formate dehydrogenase accessory sulfurtransferase FdhD [Kocuria sp.]MDO4918670.1 formate dehydrogenase accessory sulfurtransferase FdhD [Kocuria sp.]